jgi:UDP-glucose:(heptosyl)LPS alpha-1,3-glucosyltransferase
MQHLTIGFVRRGFSCGGGAEAYLRRLAAGVVEKGHHARLYTAAEWPLDQWSFGPVTRLEGKTNIAFADTLAKEAEREQCDVLMSLERIWRCDVYRAGDGVHRAWLQRRAEMGGLFRNLGRILNRKHSATLALEESLLSENGAGRVIANSKMVKDEIVQFHRYPAGRIDIIPNGVPVDQSLRGEEDRIKSRGELGLADTDLAVLFAGTGWERKGLRFAIDAVERCGGDSILLVAGRGDKRAFASDRVRFLGVVPHMPTLYAAADIFLLPTIYDPFSNACLEALAAGLPVVTTRSNGFSEIIESGVHGTVIDDPRKIEEILESLRYWSNDERREQARNENRKLAQRFDISINVARTLEVLTANREN